MAAAALSVGLLESGRHSAGRRLSFLHDPEVARRRPSRKLAAARAPRDRARSGRRVVLSTHVNADGDGCGSEAALALAPAQRGPIRCGSSIRRPGRRCSTSCSRRRGRGARERARWAQASTCSSCSTSATSPPRQSSPRRCGRFGAAAGDRPSRAGRRAAGQHGARRHRACATGELVFDLAARSAWITPTARGAVRRAAHRHRGFRFSNTSPRASRSRRAARGGCRSGGDVSAHLRIGAGGPPAAAARGARPLEWSSRSIGLAWLTSRRRGSTARCAPRTWMASWSMRARSRDAHGALLPRPRPRQGEGVLPQHGRRGRNAFATASAARFGKAAGALVGSLDEVRARVVAAAGRPVEATRRSSRGQAFRGGRPGVVEPIGVCWIAVMLPIGIGRLASLRRGTGVLRCELHGTATCSAVDLQQGIERRSCAGSVRAVVARGIGA